MGRRKCIFGLGKIEQAAAMDWPTCDSKWNLFITASRPHRSLHAAGKGAAVMASLATPVEKTGAVAGEDMGVVICVWIN